MIRGGTAAGGPAKRALAFAVAACVAIGLSGTASAAIIPALDLASTGLGAERIETLPVSKRAGAKPRVAMSLSPRQLGPVRLGDTVWAGGEIEVSVTCLEPMPKCVGTIYRYSPKVRARLVLAPGAKTAKGKRIWPISAWSRVRCSQRLPHRNHHCVMTVAGKRSLAEGAEAPCSPCYVNLVLDAYHRGSRPGNVLVVGADENGRISQDKGMVNAAVFRSETRPTSQLSNTQRPSRKRLAIGGPNSNGPKKVIYSRRLAGLRAGEQLIITAKAVERIGHLPHNVLIRSQLVLSEKRGSVSSRGIPNKIATMKGRITAQNGFNCTQGSSGYSDPCVVRKVGVAKVRHDARTQPVRGRGPRVPLYVNLVVQNRAIGVRASRYRSGNAAKIARKVGFIRVRRYEPGRRG